MDYESSPIPSRPTAGYCLPLWETLKEIKNNPEQLARVCRLAINVFSLYAYALQKTAELGRFFVQLSNTAAVIDLFSVFEAAKYFLAGQYQGESSIAKNMEIFGNLCFLGAGVFGVVAFACEISLSSLANASAAIGKVAVFAGKMAGGFAGLAFVCVLIKDVKDLIAPKGDDIAFAKKMSFLKIIKDVSDIAMCVLTVVGTATVAPVLILGIVSAGIGLAVFVFERNHKVGEIE